MTYADWVVSPPLPSEAARATGSCIVCGTQRSGTWLLCGLLDSSGLAGRPHEWFSPGTEGPNRKRWRIGSDAEYVGAVLRAGTTPNGVFAAKAMWNDVERFEAALPALPEPSYAWLRREDVVAQAVSWALAAQTGVYHVWDEPGRAIEPRFDSAEIDGFVRLIGDHEQGWESWFADRRIKPLVIRYEQVLADPQRATWRVLAALGIYGTPHIAVQTARPPSPLREEWARRYREAVTA